MTEEQAIDDLAQRGIFRLAPGLWCDKSVPDLIHVDEDNDTARDVRDALDSAGMLPPFLADAKVDAKT